MTQKRHSPIRASRRRLAALTLTAAMVAGSTALSVLAGAGDAHAAPAPGNLLAGKTIFLDPGHQGGAAGHHLDAQVPDGRGGKKDCQTTGATGVNGAKEHTVNWQVTELVKAGLESQGARVVLSRPDDTGWGGCIDQRAAAASKSGAAMAVSLHADSTAKGADPVHKGFHLIVPKLPLPDKKADRVQAGEGRKASTTMRDAFTKAGFPPANYAGVNQGIQTRSDVAAVNLTTIPAVFIEMGNLSNPDEAKTLAAHDGQLKYAMAITNGILNYAHPGAAPVTDAPNGSAPKSNAPTPGATTPDATTPGATAPGTTTPGATAPGATTPGTDSDDANELGAVLPFVQQLLKTKDPAAVAKLLLNQGQDASAQVLNAMLQVVYGLFGGKLPIG